MTNEVNNELNEPNYNEILVNSLNLKEFQVKNVLKLVDEGATVPFIARYRKEVTNNLDEKEIRSILELKEKEENLIKLQDKSILFKYKHRKYRTFIVEDSKKRVIDAPSFEDHILHYAVFSFLEEIFDKKFIENSFANRKGKGSHKAVLKLQKESNKYNYFLKMDITKYFQSVDQEILFN